METAELRYDAPLATFDCDEWNEFLYADDDDDDGDNDVKQPPQTTSGFGMMTSSNWSEASSGIGSSCSSSDSPCSEVMDAGEAVDEGGRHKRRSGTGSDDVSDELDGSLEDLVNCFDERIRHCFRDYEERAEEFAPVQIRTEQEILHDSQLVLIVR